MTATSRGDGNVREWPQAEILDVEAVNPEGKQKEQYLLQLTIPHMLCLAITAR